MSGERDFAMALAMLAEGFGEKHLTPVRIEAYHAGLKDVSIPLLNAAVRKAIQTRQFFPKVSEIRADAETCRRELIANHPYEGCNLCEDKKGWHEIEVDGVKRMARCPCSRRYITLLAGLGVTTEPLALPAGREAEWSQVGQE